MQIDIIIPSFRVDERYIVPILNLRKPADIAVHFYVVIDDPSAVIPASVRDCSLRHDVTLLVNAHNAGAAASRNRGIEAGAGEWILFLDDDISVEQGLLEIYADAIRAGAGETGFIGLIRLPAAESSFTKAIEASGSMDIFGIAAHKGDHAWGATANTLVRRDAIGAIRFSLKFPHSGGGEDVDFFLRVREHNQFRNFKTLRLAAVQHPWWNNKKVNFRRPFRYGIGNSLLPELNPSYAYRDFPNTIEVLFLCLLALPLIWLLNASLIAPLLWFMAGAIAIDLFATLVQSFKRVRPWSLSVFFYLIPLRLVHELGVLTGNLSRFRLFAIGERFHYDGKQRKIYFYRTNTHKIVKWLLYPVLIYLCFFR
ncbi:MAG: hypothetical protein DI535_19615 [Citrobacter freundii]|nr:MAG: hypothetical protein DI535_19615 [Citrobacter freundii]